MRQVSLVVLAVLTLTTIPACASGFDDKIPDQQSIDALEARASQAQPREQCFLYAQLSARDDRVQRTPVRGRRCRQGRISAETDPAVGS